MGNRKRAQAKLDRCESALKGLMLSILGPAIIDAAYSIDILSHEIRIQFCQNLDVNLNFREEQKGCVFCSYNGWKINMECE